MEETSCRRGITGRIAEGCIIIIVIIIKRCGHAESWEGGGSWVLWSLVIT